MKSLREIEAAVADGLQVYLKCPVIRSNQTAPVPPYPYVSYTITTPVQSGGTWATGEDGRQFIDLPQVWSFTVQAADDMQALQLAMDAFQWFDTEAGHFYLKQNEIAVQRVGSIGNRDNLLSIEYEYRKGFDVTFLLRYYTKQSVTEINGTIDTI
ncbi:MULTISPECIES: phage neck terminator protein [Caproicibacterium]|uniref:Phage neck terminator protein gp12-like domain-containing protein n=1 Tax=Caproicibacterium argilliputei TaxID=3030016 RepID=A0AA97DCH3_9FIRM|nr:hypothetical protein [Caproicibacterium argilliputei]WOC33053.1 hypothetical protein PXC00_04015 [Caproicibacterium argilliputei]